MTQLEAATADRAVDWATSPVVGTLSPSRAADFMTCPLRYRFRVIDQLLEPPTEPAVRGSLVHRVLDQLFDLPAPQRTVEAALALLPSTWDLTLADQPELADLLPGPDAVTAFLDSAAELLRGYFVLEDPRRLEPAARELLVEAPTGEVLLRGYVDRLDQAVTGELRVVDYKTGRSPGPHFERAALFQLKFYALVLWRARGVLARELRLYYLGDRQTLTYRPEEGELAAFERTVGALWTAIRRAQQTGDWRAAPGRLCEWCDHKSRCPAFGGTPPPLPEPSRAAPVEPSLDICDATG